MTEKNKKDRTGMFQNLGLQVKLILRLIADSRVNPFLKILPIGAFAYLIIPEPLLGPFDDALVMWLGSYLFLELCPPAIVEEHRNILENTIPGQWVDSGEDVIDGEARDID